MCRSQRVQLFLEQDVLRVDIGVDEAQFRAVCRVLESGANDLEHRSDASSTSNHADFAGECRSVDELALGTLDFDLVANLKEGDVSRNVSFLV